MGRMNRNSSNSSHKKKANRGRRIRPPGNNNEGNPDHPPPPPRASSWVDRLRFVPVPPPPPPHRDTTTGTDPHDHHTNNNNNNNSNTDTDTPTTTGSGSSSSNDNNTPTPTISIMTWNILAQAYCRRDSQVQLPHIYNQVVFHKVKRKQRLLQLLPYLTHLGNNNNNVDVLCLQEVDVNEIRPVLYQHGFTSVMETPRSQRPVNQHMTSRIDGCATYIRTNNTTATTNTTTTTTTTTTTAATADNLQNDTASTDGNNHNHNNMDHPPPQPPPVQWKLLDSELIRLDDLATLSSSSSLSTTTSSTRTATADTNSSSDTHNNNHHHVLQGIQQSLLRRNMAILVRLQHVQFPERTILVVNAHLFWNPSFEYVKLCQAHYILLRVQQYQRGPYEPVILCGDLNSRPNGGVTHTYLTHGVINAKQIAPWYPRRPTGEDTTSMVHHHPVTAHDDDDDKPPPSSKVSTTIDPDQALVDDMSALGLNTTTDKHNNSDNNQPTTNDNNEMDATPSIRYLLDASLNKLCRWLRILGQDAAIETDDEEKLRTGKGEMVIFDRCQNERRTLVTTSPRLMQRRDCPSSVYCIHPPYLSQLEVVMVHMLLSHGVELIPSTFLSRCVVCNGKIVEEHDDIRKRQILSEYEAPPALIDEGMAVFVCDRCQQGYWWNDRPTSSASRVKTAATRLLELCVRAGVPIRDDDNDDGMFQHVNYQQLREEGWDYTTPGSELLLQKLDVIEWLKRDELKCPFPLESAYLDKSSENQEFRELLPFTNVTHHFVDTLDYILFDKRFFYPIERLEVPCTFEELSDGRTHIENSHLLPSDVWPSDHLAIAARFAFHDVPINGTEQNVWDRKPILEHDATADQKDATPTVSNNIESPAVEIDPMLYCGFIGDDGATVPPPPPPVAAAAANVHVVNNPRCACGCIPSIPSLFEMAELRKQAKLKNAMEK